MPRRFRLRARLPLQARARRRPGPAAPSGPSTRRRSRSHQLPGVGVGHARRRDEDGVGMLPRLELDRAADVGPVVEVDDEFGPRQAGSRPTPPICARIGAESTSSPAALKAAAAWARSVAATDRSRSGCWRRRGRPGACGRPGAGSARLPPPHRARFFGRVRDRSARRRPARGRAASARPCAGIRSAGSVGLGQGRVPAGRVVDRPGPGLALAPLHLVVGAVDELGRRRRSALASCSLEAVGGAAADRRDQAHADNVARTAVSRRRGAARPASAPRAASAVRVASSARAVAAGAGRPPPCGAAPGLRPGRRVRREPPRPPASRRAVLPAPGPGSRGPGLPGSASASHAPSRATASARSPRGRARRQHRLRRRAGERRVPGQDLAEDRA